MARTIAQPGPERANRLIFMGAIALAIIAAVLVFVALSNFGEDGGGSSVLGGDVDVVIASRDIEPGTEITEDMLEVATLPGQIVIDGAITDRDELLGFTAVNRVARGEQFNSTKLLEGEVNEDVLSPVIRPGYRAMAIGVDADKIVGGHVRAGDRVDVIVVFEPEAGDGGSSAMASRVLMQDIKVLAVADAAVRAVTRVDEEGNLVTPEEGDAVGGVAPEDTDADPDADTVALEVPANDVALLALAAEDGTVYLALRPLGATDAVDSGTIPGIPAN
jgi:pilus assembly protein CpaB